jgi:BolA-like protein 1
MMGIKGPSLGAGVVEQQIVEKLRSKLRPAFFKVINESYKHSVPKGSETHFR